MIPGCAGLPSYGMGSEIQSPIDQVFLQSTTSFGGFGFDAADDDAGLRGARFHQPLVFDIGGNCIDSAQCTDLIADKNRSFSFPIREPCAHGCAHLRSETPNALLLRSRSSRRTMISAATPMTTPLMEI
jgi:hypothetical protein